MSFHPAESLVPYSSSAFRDGKPPTSEPATFEEFAKSLQGIPYAGLFEISKKDPYGLDRHKYTIWDEIIAQYARVNNITALLQEDGKTPIKFDKAEALTKGFFDRRIITRVIYSLPISVGIPFLGQMHYTNQLTWNYIGEIGPSNTARYLELERYPQNFGAPVNSSSVTSMPTRNGPVVGFPVESSASQETQLRKSRTYREVYPEGVLGYYVMENPQIATSDSFWQLIAAKVSAYKRWVIEKRKAMK